MVLIILDDPLHFVGTIDRVLGIDEYDPSFRPANRIEMLQQILEEKLADILGQLEPDCRILREERGHNQIAEHLHGRRRHVQAADARQIWLEKLYRILPLGDGIVDDGVESSEHRIRFAMRRRPAFTKPLFFGRRDAQNLSNLRGGEVKIRQSLVAVEDSLRDVVGVTELIRPQRDRAKKKLYDVINSVALINEMPLGGLATNRVHELDYIRLRHPVEGVLHASGELLAPKADFFRRS